MELRKINRREKMEKQELYRLFETAFPFWNDIGEQDREMFCRSSQSVCFKKGMNIHDGNNCTGVIIVRTGTLRMYMLSEDGKAKQILVMSLAINYHLQ